MKLLLVCLSLVFALSLIGVAKANAQGFYNAGTETAVNQTLGKNITMQSEREIAFILKKESGNFNNELLNISVSADGSVFYMVDSVQAGTTNVKVLQYSDANKGTTLAINPSLFPFIKVDFPQIINNTVSLTWSSVRG
jgi:hypothetical protein